MVIDPIGTLPVFLFVQRVSGTSGASVVSRVMGIVLATVAVDSVLGGFEALELIRLAPPVPGGPLE